MTTWQERRSAFTHDWLQNKLVQTLGGGIAFLRGEFQEEGFPADFAKRLDVAWKGHAALANDLIDAFEKEMTPSLLLRRSPLDRLDEKTSAWLAAVVHECWLTRLRIRPLIGDVREAARNADSAFSAVFGQLERLIPARDADQLRPLLPALEELDRRARALSAAIARLPHQIEVT